MKDAENDNKRYKAELQDVSPLLVFFFFFFCVSYQAALCVCVRKRGISEIDKGMRRGEERDRESMCVCVCV